MIKSSHINRELKELTKIIDGSVATTTDEILKGILKAQTLLIKITRDIRINQTEKEGIHVKKQQK